MIFNEITNKLIGKRDVSFDNFVKWMYRPTDPSSLGVIRILFGLLMMLDLPEERAGAEIDLRWGDSRDCHFPLFPILNSPGYPYVAVLYGIMWMGALGIALGYNFRSSVLLFGIPYWYIFLLDKTFWNNHTYLFGLVIILLAGTSANHFCSLDAFFDKSKHNAHVPYWNYFILKYQFFMLYFLAGLKKANGEWLAGYSMTDLGKHWVFDPFKFLLTSEQIDFLVVHWFGFILDLTVGFFMMYRPTKLVAMVFCALFHLMNSRLFSIGMFPYVCLATMPLFCSHRWPRKLARRVWSESIDASPSLKPSNCCIYASEVNETTQIKHLPTVVTWKHRLVVVLLLTHCGTQVFLPYSHFITKGYNNWTNGLYGYSWDMMVHAWDTVLVVVKVVDNVTGREHFLDPGAWTQNDRWSKHADMCVQFAHCVKKNILQDIRRSEDHSDSSSEVSPKLITSDNISVYLDVWCSLNGRFQQRMYDPNYNLLDAKWSPFEPVEWLLPLLTEYNDLRSKISKIQSDVYAWSNFSDVLFVADFPGLYLENYISEEITNATLTVLEGSVFYELEDEENGQSLGVKLNKDDSVPLETGIFHKIHTVGDIPACYMYTFVNNSRAFVSNEVNDERKVGMKSPFPVFEDLEERVENFRQMFGHISNSVLHILFGKPLVRRSRLQLSEPHKQF